MSKPARMSTHEPLVCEICGSSFPIEREGERTCPVCATHYVYSDDECRYMVWLSQEQKAALCELARQTLDRDHGIRHEDGALLHLCPACQRSASAELNPLFQCGVGR